MEISGAVRIDVATRLLRQEPLEFSAELIPAGQRFVGGEQRCALSLCLGEAVVLRLERRDDGFDLTVARHLGVDLLTHCRCCGFECTGGQFETCQSRHRLQQTC
ncbi:Uncharacterised protein [Mycobacteroides abscessus subsp. abscessus]|nr:Uncharacterised protein [Mycobacteroides abscessus subsp. abscessus]